MCSAEFLKYAIICYSNLKEFKWKLLISPLDKLGRKANRWAVVSGSDLWLESRAWVQKFHPFFIAYFLSFSPLSKGKTRLKKACVAVDVNQCFSTAVRSCIGKWKKKKKSSSIGRVLKKKKKKTFWRQSQENSTCFFQIL